VRNGDPARKRECGLYGENLILKIYFIVIYHLGVFAQRHSLREMEIPPESGSAAYTVKI
jgi:hypothetical protein